METNKRLLSIDALRGADMLLIMGAAGVVTLFCKAMGWGTDCMLARQVTHVDWNGLHLQDTIFPLFLFLAGASWPFSLAKQRERGASVGAIRLRVVKRCLILVLLGLLYNGLLNFKPAELVWGSVLGRIGISWAVAAYMSIGLGVRTRVGIWFALMLGYWLACIVFTAPDFPNAGNFSPEGNIGCWIDRMIMPGKLTVPKLYTNQGILGTVGGVGTAMLGVFAGEFLRSRVATGAKKAGWLLAAAAGLLAMGLAIGLGFGKWSFPINKKMWSPSFVCVVGAYSTAMLALFHWVVDVKGWTRWTFFFRVIGMNSITIYLLNRVVGGAFGDVARFFFGGVVAYLPAAWAAVALAVAKMAVAWGALYFLYRQKVFLRV